MHPFHKSTPALLKRLSPLAGLTGRMAGRIPTLSESKFARRRKKVVRKQRNRLILFGRDRFRLGLVTDPSGSLLSPSAGNFSVVFGSFQTNYSFSRFLTLSALLQMDTANAQPASANIRLRWNYRPDSDLFFIYTAGPVFCQPGRGEPAPILRKSICHQVHILLASVR